MGAAVRVVFNAVDDMLAREVALVVDNADAPLVAAASVPHGDLAAVVPSSQMLPLPRNGELQMRPALPQMVVDGSFQMAQTGRAWLVGAQGDELVPSWLFGLEDAGVGVDGGLECGRGCVFNGGGIVACGRQQGSADASGLESAYSGLQHGAMMASMAAGTGETAQWALVTVACPGAVTIDGSIPENLRHVPERLGRKAPLQVARRDGRATTT